MKEQHDNIKGITVRFDLDDERERKVWEHLHTVSKKRYKTCSNAVISELHDHFTGQHELSEMKAVISDSVKSAIREEFKRIISPQAVYENPNTPIISEDNSEKGLSELIDESIFDF